MLALAVQPNPSVCVAPAAQLLVFPVHLGRSLSSDSGSATAPYIMLESLPKGRLTSFFHLHYSLALESAP